MCTSLHLLRLLCMPSLLHFLHQWPQQDVIDCWPRRHLSSAADRVPPAAACRSLHLTGQSARWAASERAAALTGPRLSRVRAALLLPAHHIMPTICLACCRPHPGVKMQLQVAPRGRSGSYR